MQCVELPDDSEYPLHCPLCGVKIAMGSGEQNIQDWIVGKCEHLLFAAIDGFPFEYQSDGFNQLVGAALLKMPEHERDIFSEDDVLDVVALVAIPNSFMFKSGASHPSQPDCYIGFAPVVIPLDGGTTRHVLP